MIYLLLAVGLESVGCIRGGRRTRRRGRWPDPGRQLPRVVLHRSTDHAGGHALHRAFHGRRRRRRTDAIAARCAVIFAALGVGLALPYLLLSLAPWMRRALPKPGAWMDTLKQMFAFPMYARRRGCCGCSRSRPRRSVWAPPWPARFSWRWRPGRIRSPRWSSSRRSRGGAGHRRCRGSPRHRCCRSICGRRGAAASLPTSPAGGAAADESWQPYDAARVAELTAQGQPLLVNFTASWCLTCLVNERNAFADAAVQRIFRGKGVTLMKGDWTNRDPAITAALADFRPRRRAALRRLQFASPVRPAPVVLPQLLTPGSWQDVFSAFPACDPMRPRFKTSA